MPQQVTDEILHKADALFKDIWNCQKEFERRQTAYAELETRRLEDPSEAIEDEMKALLKEATNSVKTATGLKQAFLGILDDYPVITQADDQWLRDAGPPPMPVNANYLPPLPFPQDEIAQQLEADAESTGMFQSRQPRTTNQPKTLFDMAYTEPATIDPALIDAVPNMKYLFHTLDMLNGEKLESYISRQLRAISDVKIMKALHRQLATDLQLTANSERGQELAESIREQLLRRSAAESSTALEPPSHLDEDEDLEMGPYEYHPIATPPAPRVPHENIDVDTGYFDENLIAYLLEED